MRPGLDLSGVAIPFSLRELTPAAASVRVAAGRKRAMLRTGAGGTVPAPRRLIHAGVGVALLLVSWLGIPATAVAGTPSPIPAAAGPEVREGLPLSGRVLPSHDPGKQVRAGTAAGGARWGLPAAWSPSPGPAGLAAAGLFAAGGAALLGRRLCRSLPLPLRRTRDRQPGDAGPVALATGALAAALAERGFGDSAPLLVREGVRRLDVTVSCPPGDAEALAARGPALGRRLGCDVKAAVSGPVRVGMTLSWRGRAVPATANWAIAPPSLVVPVGASGGGIVYLNLPGAGTVRVEVGGRERRRLLRAWIATLSEGYSAEALTLHLDGESTRLLGADPRAPHVARLLGELDSIVRRRARGADRRHAVVAIVDLAGDTRAPPVAAMRDGPARGVYVICCLEPGDDVAGLPEPGASIGLGAAAAEGGGEGSALVLCTPGDRPLPLEPVIVRGEVSPGGADLARREVPPGSSPVPRPPALRAGPPTAGGAPPLSPAAPAAGSDGGSDGGCESCGDSPALARSPVERAPRHASGAGRGAHAGDDEAAEGGPAASVPAAGVAGGSGRQPGAATTRSGETPAVPSAEPLAGDAADPASEASASPPPPAGAPPPAAVEGGRSAGGPLQGSLLASAGPALAQEDASPAAPLFTVRCLGRFEVELGGAPIGSWPRQKSRELLALLAAQGGSPVSRESVVEALWPEEPWDDARRHVAANVVSSLRRIVRAAASDRGLAVVITERQSYRLQPGLFRVDLDLFGQALRRAPALPDPEALLEYEGAARLYGGDFLEGEFFPWLEVYRADCRRRLIEGVHRGAAIADRLGEGERAAALYGVVLEHEPIDERAARGLMRLLAAAGDVNAARRVHRRLTEALREDLDDPAAEPSPETAAVLTRAVAGEQARIDAGAGERRRLPGMKAGPVLEAPASPDPPPSDRRVPVRPGTDGPGTAL
ncbi:MAG: BTAD domain-containing putative transcriptional regulator [Chloroflexi bacterium]|nr:BTAD domain-containing putative transcriptional regulator [Chloroflexota bacterium]